MAFRFPGAYQSLGTGIVVMKHTDLGFHQLQGTIVEIYRSYTKTH